MEDDRQNAREELKAGDVAFRQTNTEVKDKYIDVEDSVEDKPESLVAYSFESKTKTFKYITVEGVKSNIYT